MYFFGEKLQKDAKISHFEFFEIALYMKSVSMPLRIAKIKASMLFFQDTITTGRGINGNDDYFVGELEMSSIQFVG